MNYNTPVELEDHALVIQYPGVANIAYYPDKGSIFEYTLINDNSYDTVRRIKSVNTQLNTPAREVFNQIIDSVFAETGEEPEVFTSTYQELSNEMWQVLGYIEIPREIIHYYAIKRGETDPHALIRDTGGIYPEFRISGEWIPGTLKLMQSIADSVTHLTDESYTETFDNLDNMVY